MSRMRNQAMISFPLVVISNILLTHGALAASPSTTAMLAAVSKIPYQTDIVPVATQKAVTNNQAPLIHDDVWVAHRDQKDRHYRLPEEVF